MKKILSLVLSLTAFTYVNAQISINATIPSSIPAGTSATAEVKINKGSIGNFAKYQMDVPVGYSVTGVDVKSGNFTFENQRAKIVWVSVPSETEFTVTFKIQADASATNQGSIIQKFFYLENNEKKEVEGATVNLGGVGSSAVASSGGSSSSSSGSGSTPVETVKSTPVETVKSTPVETVKSTPTENTVKPTSATTALEGVTYKVQLGAFTTQPTKGKFSAAGNVSIDMVDGLYKVTTGNFKTREEAVKHREELQSKGYSGLFIVMFKNGQRIK